jgi:hypothetical protein
VARFQGETKLKPNGQKHLTWGTLNKDYAHEKGSVKIGSDVIPNHTSKIEYCMDVLGPAYVTAEIKKIVGADGEVSWSKLLDNKDWVPAYKAKLNELYQQALEREAQ